MSNPSSDRPLGRWTAEVVLILVSVIIGFMAAQYGQTRQDRALRDDVLRGLLEEARTNIAMLDTLEDMHDAWQRALERIDPAKLKPTAAATMYEVRPNGGSIGVPLKRAAWSTAISSGALKLIDYDVVAALSEIYDYQDVMTENHNRFIANVVYSPGAFDPAARPTSVAQIRGILREIAGNEGWLLSLYRKHLPALEKSAGH